MRMVKTSFLCRIVNGKERRYCLDSSVTSCLEIFAPPFVSFV